MKDGTVIPHTLVFDDGMRACVEVNSDGSVNVVLSNFGREPLIFTATDLSKLVEFVVKHGGELGPVEA